MGSNKHKKESKKKKHRSRSRSPLEGGGEERERKRHKKHKKDRKKDRSPEVEEVPVDSHLAAAAEESQPEERSESRERDRDLRARAERSRHRDRHDDRSNGKERSPVRVPSPVAGGAGAAGGSGGGAQESLSVADTNKLRAKLGLKPLETGDAPPADDGKLKDDLGEFYHKPAANIAQQRKQDKLRERLAERKERRNLENKLQTTLLAEGSDDEDASAWIKKSRDIEKQKKEAAKRAALLDELDAEFGVSAIMEEEKAEERGAAYTADSLRGLRVAHDLETLDEERSVVLTLADKPVLGDDAEDVLVNVNLLDDDKYKKNQEEIRKARVGYQAYEDADDVAAAARGERRGVLHKYDDEIDKERAARERGFVLGDAAGLEAARFREAMRRSQLEGSVNRRLESLVLPAPRRATEYMNEDEIQAKFKKTKRKGKIRKKPKEEPIEVEVYDPEAAMLETDDTDVKPGLLKAETFDEDEVEVDSELQAALARARRRRLQDAWAPKVEDILVGIKEEEPAPSSSGAEAGMVLDATAEFCRTLGDIPTYGQAGNRDQRQEIMDFEDDMEEEGGREAAAEPGGAWSRVDVGSDKPADIAAGDAVGLEAEPALDGGVAGALRLAVSKGYLERNTAAAPRASAAAIALAARNYSIEDKAYNGEDDKHGRRERGYAGPLSEFREKAGFRPNVKLDYVDDDGRALCPKEAFRYLSHKFHGKGPGKNKQEKRIKKAVQEGLMKKMSSTDTPLNTLALLQEKQKETHSPFVVLSGVKKDAAH